MSELVSPEEATIRAGHRLIEPPPGRLEAITAWVADRVSPVLIKELRQALKSRAFLLTYLLLLFCAVAWSFLGLSYQLDWQWKQPGANLLVGYLIILGFPLTLVVPMLAYSSLSREFDEDTLQLLSITTMSTRKLLWGKLWSAVLQLVIFTSALAPGIAFTWMLRGVDVGTVVSSLFFATSGSLCLTAIALLFATMNRASVVRPVSMVALVILLGFLYFGWIGLCMVTLDEGMAGTTEYYLVLMFIVSIFLTLTLVALEAGNSTIAFAADNRSLGPRLATMFQVIVVATMGMGMASHFASQFVFVSLLSGSLEAEDIAFSAAFAEFFICLYWGVVGCMFCAEPSELSARVRRELPVTPWGKSIKSLLMPGGGRGYLFSVGQIATTMAVTLGIGTIATGYGFLDSLSGGSMNSGPDFGFPLIIALHALFYFTAIYWLCRWLRALKIRVGPLVGLILLVVLFTSLNVGSWCLQIGVEMFLPGGTNEWSITMLPNIFVTVMECIDGLSEGQYIVLASGAVLVLAATGFTCVVASAELLDLKVATPQRVLDEISRKRKMQQANPDSIDEIFSRRLGNTSGEDDAGTEKGTPVADSRTHE